MEGADGVKTGFTKAAGRILVSSATRQGRRIIAVTLDAPEDWKDHAALLEEGFARYSVKPVLSQGEQVGILEVLGGEESHVELLAAEDYSFALTEEEVPQTVLPGPGFVYAPAVEGADAGFVYVLINGKAVGKVPVVYGKTVERKKEEEKSFFEKLLNL